MADEVTSSSAGVMTSETGRKLCQICGDISTGFYYSVWSCEGCKAFFKRCLQAKDGANYVCPATNSCTIDKTRRKCCQACRLRKCYEVGMQKTGSRRERSARNAQKSEDVKPPTKAVKRRKRNGNEDNSLVKPTSALPPPTCSGSHIVSLTKASGSPSSQPVTSPLSDIASPESFHSDLSSPVPTPNTAQNSSSDPKSPSALKSSAVQVSSPLIPSRDIKVEVEDNISPEDQTKTTDVKGIGIKKQQSEAFEMPIHPVVKILIEHEPPVRMTNHVPLEVETEESLMTSFVKLADTELVDVITWAKNVPGYSSLTLNDRIHLVDSCWMEILVCGLIWRSGQQGPGVLCFAPDLVCSRDEYYTAGIGPIGDRMIMVAKQFKEMELSREEFVCFRSLTLLNADLCCLEDFDGLMKARQGIVDALIYTIQHRTKASERRLTDLLLLLPHVRQCGVNSTAHMFEMQHEEAFPIAELVKEMLQAQQPYTVKENK